MHATSAVTALSTAVEKVVDGCRAGTGGQGEGEAGNVSGAEELWTACVERLRREVPAGTWNTWFGSVCPTAVVDDRLVLSVPNRLAKERIEDRFAAALRAVLAEVGGSVVDVELRIDTEASPGDTELVAAARAVPPPSGGAAPGPVLDRASTRLNPDQLFEAFVMGDSNRFAHAAALAVAERPSQAYNPLFIYGGTGLGKTHLLHAIGNYVRQHYPDHLVRYVSTEAFLNDFIDAIRNNTMDSFKRRYRECDLLLVDDVQFIENKERFQEEFFHTFDSLHAAGRQIVISSDRAPRAIATLEDRLRSRFAGGLITDVQPPELETRLAILHKKAEGQRTAVPDAVFDYIATHITHNIRELEGALMRVTAYASLNHTSLTLAVAQEQLADMITARDRQITPAAILAATSTMFGHAVDDLVGKSRSRPLVQARQVAMYVFREMTDYSYPAIGKVFGNRDHTTVMHAVEKITDLMHERRGIYNQVTDLMHHIRTGG